MPKSPREIVINMLANYTNQLQEMGFEPKDIAAGMEAGAQFLSAMEEKNVFENVRTMSFSELMKFLEGAAKECNCPKCRARRAQQDPVSDL
jgi:hypothetical protein